MSLTVFESINDITSWVTRERAAGRTVGFVPTMGALHPGHISLIRSARAACDRVVVSIFVNPTQFNNPEDLKKYPRTLERDMELLSGSGCDVLFHPSVKEMYPETITSHWDFGLLSSTLEGAYRPGHFDGVLTIVKKLFEAVMPDMAFFGEKDFQQLSLIRKMTEFEKMPVKVVSCPSVRESSGLAMSSRNTRLNEEDRRKAEEISRVLFGMTKRTADLAPADLIDWAKAEFRKSGGIEVEYLAIVHPATFAPVLDWEKDTPAIALIAAYVGGVRLIDNVMLR